MSKICYILMLYNVCRYIYFARNTIHDIVYTYLTFSRSTDGSTLKSNFNSKFHTNLLFTRMQSLPTHVVCRTTQFLSSIIVVVIKHLLSAPYDFLFSRRTIICVNKDFNRGVYTIFCFRNQMAPFIVSVKYSHKFECIIYGYCFQIRMKVGVLCIILITKTCT